MYGAIKITTTLPSKDGTATARTEHACPLLRFCPIPGRFQEPFERVNTASVSEVRGFHCGINVDRDPVGCEVP